MDEILQWIGAHWVEWVFCIVGIVLTFLAKHHVKVQKELMEEKWKDKEKNMCGKIICTLEEKINEVRKNSTEKEAGIKNDLNNMHEELAGQDTEIRKNIGVLQDGILSIQGKQFRELCKELLKQDYITVEEYEDFEAEYAVYKSLGGNHRGDSLHERVVKKCDKQNSKPEEE